MAGLEVAAIRKTYSSKAVVDDITFQAEAGKITGILGPNGAGKTTTIRMIMGITAPDSGKIWFTSNGKRYAGVPRSLVGYLPEERGLYKEARVMEILQFLAGLKDISAADAKTSAIDWLAKFGLSDYANSKIEQLSKGMAQKVQFIASVIHQPEFIVLDEPFSGLDPVSQDVFKAEIRALAARGTTVLLSSHQMNIVEELCDSLFLIDKGKEVAYGSVARIKEQYGNYRVQLVADKAIESLISSTLVESCHQHSDSRWTLGLKDRVSPSEFLSTISKDASIKEINVSRLSLHDIFVKIAKGGSSNERNMENRQMGSYEELA